MARAKRLTRKEIKAPDEFQTLSSHAIAWVQENRQAATWLAAGVAVAVLALGGYRSYAAQKRADANADFARALTKLEGGDPGASAALSGVASTWGDTMVGRASAALSIAADLRAGNADAAIARAAQALESAADLPPYFRQQILLAWGAALESRQAFKEAAEKYAQAAAEPGPYGGQALLAQARATARSGNAERARELYRQFTEKFPDAPDVDLARHHAG